MPRISVLMGIYNCAPTLQEALDSLYAQTFQDFQIILCDDGSTDTTLAVAEENARRHPNIVLLRNDRNRGLNYTLNRCLAAADTELCARMDGDDISLPERFEKEVQFLDEHPEYAVVSCPMIHFDVDGEYMRGMIESCEPDINSFNYGSPFCHAPAMVRTAAYKAVGGYSEDSRLLRMEDYNLWTKLYVAGFKGCNISEHLYAMRDDKNAARRRTLRARLNGIYAHWLAYNWLHLSFPLFCKYAVTNVLLGIMPGWLYERVRNLKNR